MAVLCEGRDAVFECNHGTDVAVVPPQFDNSKTEIEIYTFCNTCVVILETFPDLQKLQDKSQFNCQHKLHEPQLGSAVTLLCSCDLCRTLEFKLRTTRHKL